MGNQVVPGSPELIPMKVFTDKRGSVSKIVYPSAAPSPHVNFADEYLARSKKNVFRGFHRQTDEFAGTKTFQVITGMIDLYVLEASNLPVSDWSWHRFELRPDADALLVPERFFTGYLVKSEEAIVLAKSSTPYAPDFEQTLAPALIFKQSELQHWILSEKDSI